MSLKCLQESAYIDVLASWNGREKKIHGIKVLCEQTRELTDDLHDFGLCLMLSGLGNFVADCHV